MFRTKKIQGRNIIETLFLINSADIYINDGYSHHDYHVFDFLDFQQNNCEGNEGN